MPSTVLPQGAILRVQRGSDKAQRNNNSSRRGHAYLAHTTDASDSEIPLQQPRNPLLAVKLDDQVQTEKHDGAYLGHTVIACVEEMNAGSMTYNRK